MSIESRAAIHAALAEPARLAIVDALITGDASPGELGVLLGLPSNLLAHHLKILTEAGLIERARSEADRRRSYVRLIPEALTGLNPAVAARTASRVLFVCTHNSARSQLAAALWNRHTDVPAASAGTEPAERVHLGAIAAAARHGLALTDSRTAHVRDVRRDDDLLVAVCDSAYEDLADPGLIHWSIRDPARTGTDLAFDTAYEDLASRIERLAPAITPAT